VGVLALATVVSAAGPPAGPGEHVTPLLAGQTIDAGTLRMYNTPQELIVEVVPTGGWLITEMQLHVGLEAPSTDKKANPAPGKFPFKKEFDTPAPSHVFVLDLQDDLGFNWGQPWEDQRIQHIALHADLVQLGDNGEVIAEEGAWASGPEEFLGSQWGWWFDYELAHPAKAHFIDSPVGGLNVHSPTVNGKTDESGGHYYFPGERVEYSVASVKLGSAVADHKVSPLDIFESADTDDPRVINMARLLQTLDADADPQPGITITAIEEACLEDAVAALGLAEIDYADDAQMESILSLTEAACTHLDIVSAEDAKANLDRSLDSNMFRKNVSKTPDLASTKAKLNIMGVWFPALRANGDPAVIEYFDENSALIRTIEEAKPIVITYTDEHPDTGAEDTWAAISRDDGNTWKRKNLSRSADRSSFTLANGFEFPGHVKKPVFQVKGNNILVSWSSKFCKGGKPGYAIDDEDEYLYDDPYYTDDIWGVAGPQRSHDYADDGFPEVGELPYSCVWVARGTVVTQGMINSGGFWATSTVGDIVWFKPERLTSGRRDALQIFMGGADGAGFAVAFQEDPKGVRPGQAHGPGSGWSGATTNHKT
ncbi:MAG: hypothetical protein KAJ43_04885, partial [Gemmatimonadetes bacterium]|nr:hypothetical protein [Gemmatimonadota bacterium]